MVLDNLSTHKVGRVELWAEDHNITFEFTATNASWMNRIECHFTPLKKFALNNSNYKDHKEQGRAIRRYINYRNRNPKDEKILKEQKKNRTA